MQSIGETLRAERHARKLSLEDISRATKIKVDILEKLEADDYAALPSPMYVKGFLKLYADYLKLDSAAITAAYLQSQGGLRRQGLHMETEAQIRARRQRELQLPLGGVVRVVGALTAAVVVVFVGYHLWRSRATPAQPRPVALPLADFEAYYEPKTKPAPELLEAPAK
jgi:cytoskeletal protein RodZ